MTEKFPSHPLPVSNRIGSRRFRRRLVAATYGGWVLVAVIVKLTILTAPFIGGTIIFLMTMIVLAVWLVHRTYINREVMATDVGLDERLVQNRNQAFRRAFQVFSLVVFIGWPVSLVVIAIEPGNQGYFDALLIYLGACVLATTLPTATWAWREPGSRRPRTATCLGRLAASDREAPFVPALGTLVKADHGVRT